MRLTTLLRKLGACPKSVEWASSHSTAPRRAWQECVRGDWMLWIATRLGVDGWLIVSAACACARPALQRVPEGEDRPRIAIEAAEAWTRDEGVASLASVAAASVAAAGVVLDDALEMQAGPFADRNIVTFYAMLTALAVVALVVAVADISNGPASAASRRATARDLASEVAEQAAWSALALRRFDPVCSDHFESSLADSADTVRAMIPWEVIREAIGKRRTELR